MNAAELKNEGSEHAEAHGAQRTTSCPKIMILTYSVKKENCDRELKDTGYYPV